MTIGREYQTPYDKDLNNDPREDGVDNRDLSDGSVGVGAQWEHRSTESDLGESDLGKSEFGESEFGESEVGESDFEDTVATERDSDVASNAGHAADSQWSALQGAFVDDPDAAVRDAAALVDEAMSTLLASLQTDRSGETSTEQKRVAFQRYRAVHEVLTRV
jgi:hypothetical protein